MNGSHKRSLLGVIAFWLGCSLFIFGCIFGIPRAFATADTVNRLLFAALPITGFLVAALALRGVIRTAESSGKGGFETRWYKRYYIEIGIATVLYVTLSVICIPLALAAKEQTVKLAWALAPALGIGACAIAVIRWVLRADEYLRQKILEAIGASAAATAVWTMAYGFLEIVGLPRLSMFWVWPGMATLAVLWFAVSHTARK